MPCRELVELVTAYMDGALPAAERAPAGKARLLGLFRARGPHSRAPLERSVPLGIADAFAAPGDHIGYVWEDDQAFDATAGSWRRV
jgi:hypothetical protein